jgi:photosystem II stability/assembly factor-like uncharacterized protein
MKFTGLFLFAVTLALPSALSAQFQIQNANTIASLRGIDVLSDKIAWASGSEGTVLLTTDGGTTWKNCARPKGGEKLDFRGVQGFDAQTAVVMASGKGALSAIYKTVDSCATWTKVFDNPDPTGFFDSVKRVTSKQLYLMGDPVDGKFAMFFSDDAGDHWYTTDDPGRESLKGDGAFAASNSSILAVGPYLFFGTGATETAAPSVYYTRPKCLKPNEACAIEWVKSSVPMQPGVATSGVFSLAGRTITNQRGAMKVVAVAVGGDYAKPAVAGAAFTVDGGANWQPAVKPPAGYRSSVAYVSAMGAFIAAGPTGTDVSRDDGKTWSPLRPSAGEATDADQSWNAISLPFIVGSKGRIGKLNVDALKNSR